MNGYNFTERVRKVLAMSREEAARMNHEYVGTEHILLGIIREGEGVAAAVLQNLGADLDDVREKIEEIVTKGKATRATGSDLPYTSRAKKVLELAMNSARDFGHVYVGTEHLLVGLMDEQKGIAAQLLAEFGLTRESVRSETLRLLDTEQAGEPEPRAAPRPKVWRGAPSAAGDQVPDAKPTFDRLADEDMPLATGAVVHETFQLTDARIRLMHARADLLQERRAWMRLRGALTLCERLGVQPRMVPQQDGSVRIEIGDGLYVAARLPGFPDGSASEQGA